MARLPLIRVLPAAVLAAVTAAAGADETHYQSQLLGERALGMGGAFTAVASDPTATYYNPAGLGMVQSSNISASLSVYGIEHRLIEGGFVSLISGEREESDLEATTYPTIPTTFAVMRGLGETLPDGSRRHAVAFSLLIPDQYDVSYGAAVGTSGETELDVFNLSEKDKTLLAGVSYALRLSDDLALGLSLYLGMRDFSRSYSRVMEIPTLPPGERPTSDYFESERIDTSYSTYDMLIRIGALYRPLPDVQVGLTLGLPSVHLWGDGSVSRSFSYAWLDPDYDRYGDFSRSSAGELDAESFWPMEIRAGLAWLPAPEYTAALDVSYHFPTFNDYDRVVLPTEEQSELRFDPQFANRTRRRGVLNINLGAEIIAAETWPIRLGFFTNLSAAPDPDPWAPSQEQIDILGGTLSVGHRFSGFAINVGVLASGGWGSAQAYNLTGDGPSFLERDAEYQLFYFFISGAQEAVTTTVSDLVEDWVNPDDTAAGDSPPAEELPPEASIGPAAEAVPGEPAAGETPTEAPVPEPGGSEG